ncbi:hypothetical protein B0P06_000286 [Clostridium saccharoperbutylacetonicum]|uniref:Uncharacterized protein n=1 Tax=Clostridium saccharoperbutylacetonicum N1-4(HMT) TaxID=931276 RepID=M1MLE4_9CLOT|nr:hypothetical protein [Clostridium saccharoperbutylacetonicum]AGF55611.1 hypothetical protein Cspa_c18410 [Clostridium saccharoperbutylacetonicum N1-4(HMT)]NRT63668.1 hypothetical protein [Clostridium saccharoperbutylacetonicum]NSB27031.1 hypothetical protein [Clostridium saccharoperbutylacetonicum]NSB40515.1 hypothetical protein [Clostridium saccharoperbutylacetonicum]
MSFGDGIAKSIGNVGYSKIIPIADGTAIVNSSVDVDILQFLSPSRDKDVPFERTVITDNITINNIRINSDTQFVISGVDIPITCYTCGTEWHNVLSTVIDQYYPNPAMLKATCQVIDKNDANKYITQYLTMNYTRVHSNIIPISCYKSKYLMNNSKYVLSKSMGHKEQLYDIDVETKATINWEEDYDIVCNPAVTFIENRIPYTKNSITLNQPVSVNVEDYKPPIISPDFSGGALNSFRIVVQKCSYFEQYLSFKTGKIVDISGLPQGMVYELGYLKGSPLISGKYPISIKMEDKSVLSGLLIVTQVPREL